MVDVNVNFVLEEQEPYNAEFTVNPDVTYVADMRVLTGTRDHTELYNRDVANQHPMSAITGLEGALSNEATARENADTQLQNNIDAEVLRATTAEDSLNTKIEAETSRAKSVESQLSDDIVAENTRALSAEETLQDNINTEETRAKGVENQLRNDLTAETTRASTAEEGLQSAINTEKSRAENAENALRVDLEELETSINDDISDLNNKIEAETSRAETAETTLTTNLNSEISTRVSEISRVEGLIVAEEERATNVESDLQSDISSEASTRASEITRVEGLISAETSRATGIENTLRDDLTSEATARQNADTTLQNSITAEATTRSNADTTLQNNIDTLTTTVSSNYTTLDNKITTETTNRENADNNLQSQIDAITASSDVTDIVGTYAQLLTYDTSTLAPNSIIKVLQDENRNNETTYYRWVVSGGVGSWVLIGEEGPYYTKSEADAAFVPQSRTINGQALSANVTLTANDVGATTQSYVDAGLSTKQDVISDLATIRTNATNGASAYTTIQNYGNIVTHNVSEFATSAQGALADTAVQPSDLATVATSGNYNDLSNKPTIPAAQVNSDWNATSGVARILNKPTIPTVPTNISAFTNDAGYITNAALTGYATENYVDSGLSGKQDVLTAGTDLEIVGYAPTTVSGNGSVSLNNAIANGLISVTLTGGCEQNGTPTPTNPVDIICNNGAIKSSKNIFDKTLNAATGSASRYWEIQVPNGTYTCSTNMPHSGGSANVWFDIQPVFSSNVNPVFASQPRTITVTEGVLYVAVRSGGPYDSLMSGERWVQVEQGNTPTTYHPYGIYIDGNIETISDGNGNTAIAEYLLSVGDYKDTQELLSGEITRNVGIKVLDGTEPWFYNNSGGNSVFYSSSTINTNVFGVPPYSNKYIGIASASGRTDGNIYIININNSSRLDVVDNRFTNATDWKAYLSEQYYAGNPVIVVYAIGASTSETAQAQTLTTQEGSNTISITQASINNLPVSVNYNMSGTPVINFTNETGYTSFSEIKDKLAYYGTCTTGASTQNKIVDCNGFELSEGVSIRIKFTDAQTYNGQPTLNVNNTGAIGIALRSDTDGIRYMWQAGDVIEFTYDGTSWIWERGGVATTTYYGVTKLISSATSSSASLSLTASSLNGFSRDMVSGAQTYSTSTTYAVGDRVRYQYQTWECTSPTTGTWNKNSWTALDPLQIQVDGKQDILVSGTNIKTINNTSILGSGNIDIQGGSSYTAGTGIDITNDVISVTNAISTGAALGATAVQPSDLATVATSGSYSDLTNKPTIPSAVTEATVSGWGFTKNTGTVTSVNNVSPVNGNVTLSIPTVPTNISAFTNDSGYITTSALNGYEQTSNKVTSISSSSTNTQYPSAKCVYDIVGDIETLINAL